MLAKKTLKNCVYMKFRGEEKYFLLFHCEDPSSACLDLERYYRSRNYYITNAVVKYRCYDVVFKVMKVIFNHPFDKSKSFILKYYLK